MRRFAVPLEKLIQVAIALLVVVISCPALSESEAPLDPTFAVEGVAKIAFGSGKSWATRGVAQPDGKIIVAGSVSDEDYAHAMALARTNPNGTLDNGFGDNGIVVTKVGVNSRSEAVGLTPDGRIIVAGWAYVEKGREGITLAVYNADGSLDSRFGKRGILIFPMEYSTAYVYALAVLPDGKIVVGGKIKLRKEYRDQPFVRSELEDSFFLARLKSDGTFDESFGRNGVVVTDVGGGVVRIEALALQPDGKLIAAGTRQRNPNSTLVTARYNADGSLDKHFGVEGLANRTMEKGRYSSPTISTTPDGGIFLIAGYALQDDCWLLLSRLRGDGSPDLAFGETGTITTKTMFWRYSNFIPLVLPDGKIQISATTVRPPKPGKSQPPFHYSFSIARFLPTGEADNSFGNRGMHVVSIGAVNDAPAYMTAQDNGRTIVVGHSVNEEAQQVVVIGLVP